MACVIPPLSGVWRSAYKFLQFSVLFQNSDSMHLQPKVSSSSSFTVLCFLSLNPSGKHSMCTLHLSRFYSHSKSASTNIVTFHSPNAHSQDVLKCQMLNGTKKHFSTFLLMCNVREKAEIALTSVDLLDLNTPLLSSGSSRAINTAAISPELATEHKRTVLFLWDVDPSSSVPVRAEGFQEAVPSREEWAGR